MRVTYLKSTALHRMLCGSLLMACVYDSSASGSLPDRKSVSPMSLCCEDSALHRSSLLTQAQSPSGPLGGV